jgi:hypothetical protein
MQRNLVDIEENIIFINESILVSIMIKIKRTYTKPETEDG